jgi:SAM-dependent methyltransferase
MKKIPKWKEWLSYIYEFDIESVGSAVNEVLHVSYSKGRYQLSTENAIYSFGDLYTNFYYAFERLDLEKLKIENVLILGFGLGSIPLMLEKNFNQNYNYTGVEIDEEVIYLANKYVTNELDASIEMICADALMFLEVNEEKYDMICVDLFLDDIIPAQFEQQDFLIQIKNKLSENGILLYNRLALTDQDQLESETFFEMEFLPIFPKGRYLDVDGNWILLNE